jgi:hypothetical protein
VLSPPRPAATPLREAGSIPDQWPVFNRFTNASTAGPGPKARAQRTPAKGFGLRGHSPTEAPGKQRILTGRGVLTL